MKFSIWLCWKIKPYEINQKNKHSLNRLGWVQALTTIEVRLMSGLLLFLFSNFCSIPKHVKIEPICLSTQNVQHSISNPAGLGLYYLSWHFLYFLLFFDWLVPVCHKPIYIHIHQEDPFLQSQEEIRQPGMV